MRSGAWSSLSRNRISPFPQKARKGWGTRREGWVPSPLRFGTENLDREKSEQPLLAFQIAEGADIGQGKGEAVLVFIADGAEGEAAVFEAEPAAGPVIGGLGGGVLEQVEFAVEADVGGGAPAALGGAAVAELSADLVKKRRHAGGLVEDVRNADRQGDAGNGIDDDLAGHLQIGVAGAHEEVAEMEAGIERAGVDAAFLAVIVELPFQVAVGAGAYAEVRNHGREAPGIGQK